MENKLRILTAGGDMRQISCAAALSKEYDTAVIGFDKEYIPTEHSFTLSDMSEGGGFDYAVLPVPPLDNEGYINTPCFSGRISPRDIAALMKPNAVIFAGHAGESLKNGLGDFEICDYLAREELSLKNAVPTAEGAVQIALDELPVTLNGLSILIVGMGRIGTALAAILKGFGSDVTAAVHNERGAAKARIAGIKSVRTDKMPHDYSLVFNTAEQLIFTRERLAAFGKDTLFIDLASKPGGIDFDAAAELGVRAIWALGLPGKTAPVTSGEIIAETVSGIIAERRAAEHD